MTDGCRRSTVKRCTCGLSDSGSGLDPVRARPRARGACSPSAAQLEIWFGSEVAGHRLDFALVAPLITAPIAVRRRYPTLVGIAVPVLGAIQFALGRDPQIVSGRVAIFCALYALAVWTPPRRFALGLALVVAVDLADRAGPRRTCATRCRSPSSRSS